MRPNLLIVEDNNDQREALAVAARQWGYKVQTATDGLDATDQLSTVPAHVIVTDLAMPRLDGYGLLRWLAERGNAPPTIVMTAYGDVQKAVTVVHELGAFWFLEKPFEFEILRALLGRATEFRALIDEKDALQRRLAYSGTLGEMLGRSAAMQQVFALIQQVAPTSAPVLITGESGTGKELVAQTICKLSPRKLGPFVAVNCAALPEALIESELFGHEKGSFTGAAERRLGCFRLAHGGTLLLDEIAEMHPATQAKLLRVLENGRVRPIGAASEVEVDARVLAATNQVPEVAVSKGQLREDLYYRLNVFRIHMPPLSERREDLDLLANALLFTLNQKHGCRVTGVEPAAAEQLRRHSWPGNVRELRNVLERAVILARAGMITQAHLQFKLSAQTSTGRPSEDNGAVVLPVGTPVAEAERHLILKTLEYTHNNKARAAELLGMSRKSLYNKLR